MLIYLKTIFKLLIEAVDVSEDVEVKVNQSITVKARINLAGLTPAGIMVNSWDLIERFSSV